MHGVTAGNRVVVRCMNPKLTEVSLPFQFQSHRWYHVVVAHSTGSALTSSVVRLFVNGNLEASSRFKYAKVSAVLCMFPASSCVPAVTSVASETVLLVLARRYQQLSILVQKL